MKRIILLLISAFVLACSVMTIVGGKETDNFIKYAEFNVTADALQKAVSYDISSQSEDTKLNYIEILAYLGAKYGGDYSPPYFYALFLMNVQTFSSKSDARRQAFPKYRRKTGL